MSRVTDRLKPGRMGIAALIVSGGILISRVLGVVREIIFAGMLGADGVTDQYVAAFRIPDYANYLLAGGFLTITFIPIFSKYLADEDETEGWRGFSSIVRWLAIGITVLIIGAWFAAPWIIETIYPEFTADQISNTVRLTRIVMPAQFAFVVGAMFASVQYAKGIFTIPTLAPIIYNISIIAGGVIFSWVTGTADPEGFVWGAVAGAFIGNLAVQWWGARRVGMRLDFSGGWRHTAVGQYILMAIPLMIGQTVVAFDETFMSVFGDLVGDGAHGVDEEIQLVFAFGFCRLDHQRFVDDQWEVICRRVKTVIHHALGDIQCMDVRSVRPSAFDYEFVHTDPVVWYMVSISHLA